MGNVELEKPPFQHQVQPVQQNNSNTIALEMIQLNNWHDRNRGNPFSDHVSKDGRHVPLFIKVIIVRRSAFLLMFKRLKFYKNDYL